MGTEGLARIRYKLYVRGERYTLCNETVYVSLALVMMNRARLIKAFLSFDTQGLVYIEHEPEDISC